MNCSCSQNMLNLSGASVGCSSLWSAARHTNVVEWCGTLNRLRALQATTCNNVPMCMRLHGFFVSLILQAEFQFKPSALHNNSVWGAASKLSPTQWAVQLGHLREIKASTSLLRGSSPLLSMSPAVSILEHCFGRSSATSLHGNLCRTSEECGIYTR